MTVRVREPFQQLQTAATQHTSLAYPDWDIDCLRSMSDDHQRIEQDVTNIIAESGIDCWDWQAAPGQTLENEWSNMEQPAKRVARGLSISLFPEPSEPRNRVNSLFDHGLDNVLFPDVAVEGVENGLPFLHVPTTPSANEVQFPVADVATEVPFHTDEVSSDCGSSSTSGCDSVASFDMDVVKDTAQKTTTKKTKLNRTESFTCPVKSCTRSFNSHSQVIEHAEADHDNSSRRFLCSKCSKAFVHEHLRDTHEETHTRTPVNYNCCGKVFATREGFRLHRKNHHENGNKLTCQAVNCKFQCVRQADLRVHIMRKHTNDKPFPCREPGCNKSFAVNAELRRHATKKHHRITTDGTEPRQTAEEKARSERARERTLALLQKSTMAAKSQKKQT